MEYLNNIKQKIPPEFQPYIKKFTLCAKSFYHNSLASGKCIYKLFSFYEKKNISATTFIEYVNEEVKNSENKDIFESGVWISTFYLIYCAYLILWYVLFGLLFILLFPTVCWLFLWGIILFVKDKLLVNKTPNQVIRETNELRGTLFDENSKSSINNNFKEEKLD